MEELNTNIEKKENDQQLCNVSIYGFPKKSINDFIQSAKENQPKLIIIVDDIVMYNGMDTQINII